MEAFLKPPQTGPPSPNMHWLIAPLHRCNKTMPFNLSVETRRSGGLNTDFFLYNHILIFHIKINMRGCMRMSGVVVEDKNVDLHLLM